MALVDPADVETYMGPSPVDAGHCVRFRVFFDSGGSPSVVYEQHANSNGDPCIGALTLVIPGERERNGSTPMWDVVQSEPLTLSPSILCRSCGKHGYIHNGRWEEA